MYLDMSINLLKASDDCSVSLICLRRPVITVCASDMFSVSVIILTISPRRDTSSDVRTVSDKTLAISINLGVVSEYCMVSFTYLVKSMFLLCVSDDCIVSLTANSIALNNPSNSIRDNDSSTENTLSLYVNIDSVSRKTSFNTFTIVGFRSNNAGMSAVPPIISL